MVANIAAHTAKIMSLCSQAPAQRTTEDTWFIRDRLHERSSFFRLWPSQLQQLICRLARPMHWVQNEVASQDSKPSDLCFILDGQAAVAVRSAPGSSQLKDIAVLQPGDTFGEASLLGAQRNTAYIVARSKEVLALAVDAQALAQAMLHQQQQSQASGKPQGLLASDSQQQQQVSPSTWTSDSHSMSVDALYKLIGQPRRPAVATLSIEQQRQVEKVQHLQLQKATDTEASTVGSWMAPPHHLATPLGSGSKRPGNQASTIMNQHAALQEHGPPAALPMYLQSAATPRMSAGAQTLIAQSGTSQSCTYDEMAGSSWHQQADNISGSANDSMPFSINGSADAGHPQRSTEMYRARHSAILHAAVMKASGSQ